MTKEWNSSQVQAKLNKFSGGGLVSTSELKRRIISAIAAHGGTASRESIIGSARGRATRLLSSLEDLAASGLLIKNGYGRKGSPISYTLPESVNNRPSDKVDSDEIMSLVI